MSNRFDLVSNPDPGMRALHSDPASDPPTLPCWLPVKYRATHCMVPHSLWCAFGSAVIQKKMTGPFKSMKLQTNMLFFMSNRFDLVSNPDRKGGHSDPDPTGSGRRYPTLPCVGFLWSTVTVRITMVPRSLWCAFSVLEQGEQGPHNPGWGAGGPPALPGKSGAEPAP